MAEPQLDLLEPLVPDSDFLVRQSSRARHLSINIGLHGVVEIVVPRRTRPAAVQRFVQQHRAWIERNVREIRAAQPHIELGMPDDIFLSAIDERWTVTYGAQRFRAQGRQIELSGAREDRAACRAQLRRWLRRRARLHLVPQLERRSRDTGLEFARAQVRGQRTRWGSYSSSGTISLNFCLLFLEPELVDYLFIHELCHTRVMNHSRRYWQLVSRYKPDYRELERRLDAAWRDVPAWVSGMRG